MIGQRQSLLTGSEVDAPVDRILLGVVPERHGYHVGLEVGANCCEAAQGLTSQILALGWCKDTYVLLPWMQSLLFAPSFTERSGMNWVPQHGWTYSGGEWTAYIGDDGKRGVLVETYMADFNELFEALGGER